MEKKSTNKNHCRTRLCNICVSKDKTLDCKDVHNIPDDPRLVLKVQIHLKQQLTKPQFRISILANVVYFMG